MATVKLTSVRGKPAAKDVTIAAGTAEAVTDTVSINIDYTKMTKGDVLLQIETIKQRIFASKWPIA